MSRTIYTLAFGTAVATFLLLLVGGIVHGTDSGMACPESSAVPLPLCAGAIWPEMTGKVFWEHGHRLFATGVGVLTIALAVGLWLRRRADGLAAGLGVAALVLVIVQGLLGRLTVVYNLPDAISIAHLATSQVFFGLLIYLVWRVRAGLVGRVRAGLVWRDSAPAPAAAPGFTLIATLAIFGQVVLGAVVRHLDAGLACLDFPLCGGRLVPDGTLALVQMAHRAGGVIAGTLLVIACIRVRRRATSPGARRLALGLKTLLLAQIVLGWLSVRSFLGVAEVTAHLGVGVLLLAGTWSMHLLVSPTLLRSRAAPDASDAPPEPGSAEVHA